MKVLVITNLFPNALEPVRGAFNRQQVIELSKLCELKVIAPLPLHYDKRIPDTEVIDDIAVCHPRYFMTPKIGRSLYGYFFYLSLVRKVKALQKSFDFDMIYATWAYPDGFGSYLIAKALKKPIVIKVHGSDINIYTKYFLRRKLIVHALKNSNAVIAVSNALKDSLVSLGVPQNHVVVVPNGINTDVFKPLPQTKCREELGLPAGRKIVLFIGNLVPVKGVSYLIEAFTQLVGSSDVMLVILGDGNQKEELIGKADALHLKERVVFMGRQPHDRIPLWMNACDIFCLPSMNEGCPNVILEALACGKQVVATKVGGIPEIITSEEQGVLVPPGNADALANALEQALRKPARSRAEKMISWQENARRVHGELEKVVALHDVR